VFRDHELFEENCFEILDMTKLERENYEKFEAIFEKINLQIDEPLAVLIVYIIE